MPDKFSPQKRSAIMARIKGRDTKPEKTVRSILHSMGYRFRIQRKDLPGNPDIVLPKYRKVIFVHGCFWHGHEGCARAAKPTSNREFWNQKLSKNAARDARNLSELNNLGWHVLAVWQCELKDREKLIETLRQFMQA